MLRFTCIWAATVALLTLVAPASAAEVDKLLPADTEFVVNINIRQVLGSELLKKFGLDKAKEALKNEGPVSEVLQSLGFDPFKDLDRLTIASPGGAEQDRGLIIIRGTFDTEKFNARAAEVQKANADALKLHKVADGSGGQHLVYEAMIPDQPVSIFVAIAGKDVILASPGKDYVVDGLKRMTGKAAAGLRNKDMQTLLEKMDEKQSLSIAGLGSALAKSGNLPDNAKDMLEKLEAIGGGLTVTDEVKLEIVLAAKTPEAAKEIDKTVGDGLNQALGLVALFAGQKKELAPAIDVLKTVRSTAKGKLVTIKGQVTADIIEKALGQDK